MGPADVRTGLTGFLLAAIAVATLAVGASAVGSYAQAPGQGHALSAPNRTEARQPGQARAAQRHRQGSKKSATKQPAPQPADTQSRIEFTVADEAVARLPGLPAEVRFWG